MKLDKNVKYIVIHCSATPPSMDIGADTIDKWHKQRGWNGIGYHDVIRRNGHLEYGRNVDTMGAHVKGYNHTSVGICLIGGINKDGTPENNFTDEQFKTLARSIGFFKSLYKNAKVVGHRELDKGKACPSFDVQAWLKEEREKHD